MSLTVHTSEGSYQFDGPHVNTASLSNRSGVYVITTIMSNGFHKVLDVGESRFVKDRILNHDRKGQWIQHQLKNLCIAVLYCDEQARMSVEQQIRNFHSPPCGLQ